MGVVKDVLSGNTTKNEKKVDKIHDTQKAIIDAEAYAMTKSEQYSESEISNFVSENNKKNEESRKDMMDDAKKATRNAIIINAAGVAMSVGLAGGASAANGGILGKGLGKVGGGIKSMGKTIARKVPVVSKIASSKAGNIIGTIGRGTTNVFKKVGEGINKLGTNKTYDTLGNITGYTSNGFKTFALQTGAKMAPFAVTQAYTRIKSGNKAEELDAVLDNLNTHLENMEQNKDAFGENFKIQCESFAESYNASSEVLLNKYSTGEMSDEEYAKATEEMAKEYSEKLEIMKEEFPDVMRSEQYEKGMIEAAVSNTDKKAMIENSWMYAEQHELNPEVYKKCETIAENRNGTAETGFGRFWKSLNSTIIKYVPAIAYIEATALKAVDSTYDFIRDAIVGDDKKSKYQDESITSLAKSIQTDCAEHLEKREIATNTTKEMRENGTSMDGFTADNQTMLAQLEDEYIGNENTESENTGVDYALV